MGCWPEAKRLQSNYSNLKRVRYYATTKIAETLQTEFQVNPSSVQVEGGVQQIVLGNCTAVISARLSNEGLP